jgi:hypothetical protein
MKNLLLTQTRRAKAVGLLAVFSFLAIVVVRALPDPTYCSDSQRTIQNTCTDCPDCAGTRYDYQNNGILSCLLTNEVCTAAGTGTSDCWEIVHSVWAYDYYSYWGQPCGNHPCIPVNTNDRQINYTLTQTAPDANCAPQ